MDVPIEVVVYLFKYLSHSDRVSAGQTCRLWYEAACDNAFQNRECVYFIKNTLQDGIYPCNVYQGNTVRKIVNFSLREMEITSKILEFWKQNCYSIKFLEFDQCDIQERTFVNILNQCVNLESLTVSNCRELFMSARFIEDDTDSLGCLKDVKNLNLSQNRYLTDALFSKLVSNMKSLVQLNLSDCPVSFHSGLYKKFYPFSVNKEGHKTPSESVLTFHYILEFLKTNNGSKIKKLSFNNTLIDGVSLKIISQLPHLKLTSLEMFACDQLNHEGLLALTQYQNNLIELNIGRCSRVTDQSIICICQNLRNLKSLCIKRCRAVTNVGLAELWNLKKLERLDISECELITREGIINGICQDVNPVLVDLNISALNLDESIVILISEKIPNMIILNMNFNYTSVTDNSIQSVFKNLIHLRSLKISHCDQVSDAGLTGMGMGKHMIDTLQKAPIRRSVLPPENFHRISLRSRAEEEIVRDAQRKKDVREMCENVGENIQGYSMALLKNLEYLSVNNCNRITDVSLIYAFNCIGLKTLNLGECKQITSEGLKHLTAHCPSIQTLDLVNCYSVTDQAVSAVVKNLCRLKHLHLRGCNLLTDSCLDVIRSECKMLKFLDLQGCRNISPELANSLLNMPTLHTLHLSKPGPYITDGLKNRLPTPPPLPALTSLRRRIF